MDVNIDVDVDVDVDDDSSVSVTHDGETHKAKSGCSVSAPGADEETLLGSMLAAAGLAAFALRRRR